MPDVGVLNLSIKSNSASAATNLNNLADALTHVKSVVGRTLGSKIEGVATAIEKIKAATQGGMGTGMAGIAQSITSASKNLSKSNAASNFRKAAEAIDEYVNAYHKLIGATSSDKVRAGSMMKLDLGQFGQKTKLEVSDLMGEQLKMDLDSIDSGFKNVERTIQGAVEDSNELMSTINGNSLDFSKFDISKLPISSLGMKMDEASRDITRFGTVVKDTFETIRDQGALDTVSKIEEVGNAVTAIIPYNENLNNSWENICNTISQANGKISEQADIVESVNAAQVAKEQALDADAVETVKVNIEVQKPSGDTLGEFAKEEIEASKNTVQLNENLKKVDKELKQKKKDATGAAFGFHDLSKAIKHLFPTLSKIEKQFGKIMLRRSVTAVIRAITRSFKEGVENVYKYSEAIGSGFAPALDSAKSMIAQFKNSIGAAAAPLIQALIPVFNQIVSAAIQVINVLNQLFALLGGQSSWTRALPATSKAFEDTKNAAKGAGGAVKDMLADFDELNVLDQGGGGGGGGAAAAAAEEYENMFEQVGEFDKRIKDFVGWLEDHLSIVHGAIAAIVAMLLGLPLSISIGIGLIVTGIEDSYNAGYDIGANGLNKQNIVNAAKGVLETTLGGALIGWKLGGPGGALIGAMIGFTLSMVMIGIGIADAERDKLYGKIHWESDRLEQELNKLFKYDNVNIAISNMSLDHTEIEDAKKNLIKELETMNLDFDYDKIKLGVDKKESLEKMIADVNNVVAATNVMIQLRKKAIKVGLEVTTQFDDPEKVISFSTEQWNNLDAYVTGLGNQIGEMISDGISIDEVDVIERLRTQLNNVTQAIAYGEMAGRFVGNVQKGYSGTEWENLDRDTLQAYTSQYIDAKNELMDAFRIQAQDTKESLGALYYGMLQRNIDNPGSVSKEALETARQNWLQFDIDQDVIDKWVEYGEEGRQIYTQNVASALAAVVDRKGTAWKSELATKSILKNNLKNLREWVVTNIADNIGFDEKVLINAFDTMEFTGWEVLGEDARKKMIYEMQRQFGINSGLYSELKNQLNVPIDDILATNSYAWDKWGNKERIRFCQAIVDAYGAPAAIEAARAAGINIQAAIDDGILEGGEVGNTASQLKNQIDAELAKNPVNVDVNANVDVMIDALVSVKTSVADGFTNAISAITKTAQINIEKPNNKNKNALKASGAYGIPAGDLFIANEQGAELVGSMNGKTTVANQGQIIEGISSGVERANEEQNALLREQNNLLRRLLEKDATVRIGASAALGRTVKQSLDMYGGMAGG